MESPYPLDVVERPTGFEPATSSLVARHEAEPREALGLLRHSGIFCAPSSFAS
jgi:hypothetical protein